MRIRCLVSAILAVLVAGPALAVSIGDADQRPVTYVVPCYPTGTPGECAPASNDTPPPSSTSIVQGSDGSTARTFLTDSSGRLYVNINGTPAVTVSSGTVNANAYQGGVAVGSGNALYVQYPSTPAVTVSSGTVSANAYQGGSAVSSSNPLYVQISPTGATVFPELDASKALQPLFVTVSDNTETSQFTTGCSGACRRVTVCNTNTSGTGCVKLSSSWTTGYPVYPRGSTGAPACVSFQNVTYVAGGTNEAGLCNGAAVTFAVIIEDD